jgi:hypothetical protein
MKEHGTMHSNNIKENNYFTFALMIFLSFVSMYFLMYSMVNVLGNVYNSLNQLYMALLMTMPMIILEMFLMRKMYSNKSLNTLIVIIAILVFFISWFGIRNQLAINDEEFIKSMIPHHAGAILMCENATLSKKELQDLCAGIISGQQEEIDQMKTWLNN